MGVGGLCAGACKESSMNKQEMRADIDFLDVSVRRRLSARWIVPNNRGQETLNNVPGAPGLCFSHL